jgi:HTH-type transcriptional regulator/antitoxin HigA
MKQHQPIANHFPEINDKTTASKVLNGKRVLQRQAIEKLSKHFAIRPALLLSG